MFYLNFFQDLLQYVNWSSSSQVTDITLAFIIFNLNAIWFVRNQISFENMIMSFQQICINISASIHLGGNAWKGFIFNSKYDFQAIKAQSSEACSKIEVKGKIIPMEHL